MSLLLNIRGLFFIFLIFVLVIKRVFLFSLSLSLRVSQLLSICLLLAYPGSPGGSQGKKRDRGICVPAGWEAQLKFSHLEYIQRA